LGSTLTNFSNYILMSYMGYTWFHFMAASEQLPERRTRKGQIYIAMPMVCSTLIALVLYLIAPGLWVSETGEFNTLYYPMMIAAPIVYSVGSIGYSVIQARRRENRAVRHHYLLIGAYPMMVAVVGLAQLLALSAPVFCFGCTIMMLYFYIHTLEDQISMDPLTRVNNRGELMRYVNQSAGLHQEGLHTYVMMVDVNDFKFINDTYGHAEGDRALVLIADSLKKALNKRDVNAFLGRYGGDEFILIVHTREEELLQLLCQEIRSILSDACRESRTPYHLTVGIGCDELLGGADSFEACMKRADQKMYTDKRLQKDLMAG
jgi:diguanylate cyclase (GGDEF)-like protein